MATSTRSRKNPRHRTKRRPREPRGRPELLLIQPIPHLGNQGDVVKVKAGYARNYLLPQGLAIIATDHHKRMVEKYRAGAEAIEKARVASLYALAADLAKHSITIEANADDEGHLYGSVKAREVSAALKRSGFSIEAEQVRLTGPLKELGLYTVKIHLGASVNGDVKIWVVPSVTDEDNRPVSSDAIHVITPADGKRPVVNIEEFSDECIVLRRGHMYHLNLLMRDEGISVLDSNSPVTRMPEQGVLSQWVIYSSTVSLRATDDTVIAEEQPGEPPLWRASFELLIPPDADTPTRRLAISPHQSGPVKIVVFIYVRRGVPSGPPWTELHRRFSIPLNVTP